MDNMQLAAFVAAACVRSGVCMERIGLSMGQDGRVHATPEFKASIVYAQPENTDVLGTRESTGLVATLTHCTKIKRQLFCEQIGIGVFRVYW